MLIEKGKPEINLSREKSTCIHYHMVQVIKGDSKSREQYSGSKFKVTVAL